MVQINFAKMNESVIIPSKKDEDAGYDIYANFQENYMAILPHHTVMIPTQLKSAFSSEYFVKLVERGSTGTKGIAQRSGVIDSGYRGEWFVPLTNTSDKILVIAKEGISVDWNTDTTIVYPYKKAICQAVLLPVPKTTVVEITEEELMSIPSCRGEGRLGESGK